MQIFNNKMYITNIILIISIVLVMSGCTSNPAIDKSKKLVSSGNVVAAFDLLYAEYQKAGAQDKKVISAEMNQLSYSISKKHITKAEKMITDKANIVTYRTAVNYLKSNLKYDYNNNLESLLMNYQSELEQFQDDQKTLLSDFTVLMQKGEWNKAYKTLTKVNALNPGFADYDDKVDEFHHKRNGFYEARMNQLINRQQWIQANTFLNAVENDHPAPKDSWMNTFKVNFKSNMTDGVLKRAEYLISRHKYYEAHNLLSGVEIDEKKRLMFIISRKGVQYYIKQAKAYMEVNNDSPDIATGKAYIFTYKAIQLDKYNQEAFALHRDLQDKIINKIKTYIAVSTFGSPTNAPGFGLRFSDSLIAYLTKNLPFSIEVVEKSKIDNDPNNAELSTIPKHLNLKLHIMGNISTLSVERHRDTGKKTVFVTVQETEVSNPIYDNYFKQYGPDKNKWPRIVPATITNKENQSISYNMGVEKINALMTASVRLYDTEQNAITKAEIYKTEISKQDDFNDAVEIAKIQYNPLNLPSDNTVKEQMIENLIKKIGQVVLVSFQNLEKELWIKAEENIKRREYDKALQYLAEGIIYSINNNLPEDNEWYAKIKNAALIELTD